MADSCPNCGETTHPCIAPGVFGDRDQHLQCQRCGWTSAIPGLRKRIADLHRAKALCEDEAGNLRRELQAEKDDHAADVERLAREVREAQAALSQAQLDRHQAAELAARREREVLGLKDALWNQQGTQDALLADAQAAREKANV